MNEPARTSKLGAALLSGLLLASNLPAAPLESNLPDLGDESAAVVSPQDERRLGDDFMREAHARLDIVPDPELNEYLQRLGHRLTAGIGLQSDFRLFIVNDPTINAFAVPPGFIGVHTGLLLSARDESELAAVLAHETAHITQRHIQRLYAESQRLSAPTLAAVLAGILIAASGGQGGEAAVALATAGATQHQINFTRGFEEEADRIGMKILNSSGYDGRAMPAAFERMEAMSRVYETDLPEFLRTHPVTARRIAESQNHALSYSVRAAPDNTDFQHMQARLRAISGSPEDAVKYFRGALDQGGAAHPSAYRYGFAEALLRARQFDAARRENNALLAQRPEYQPYLIQHAAIELGAAHTKTGLDAYAAAARRFPDSFAVTQLQASALLAAGRASDARVLLDKAVRQFPNEPELYRLLASAAGDSGRRMEAHRAFGEYYYLIGRPHAAVEQLEIAIRFADKNFYYVSSLEARIREIRDASGLLFKEEPSPAPPGKDRK